MSETEPPPASLASAMIRSATTGTRRVPAECVDRGDNITGMITDDDRRWLTTSLQPLCGPLYQSFDRGVAIAHGHFDSYPDCDQDALSPLRSHLTRFHTREAVRGFQRDGDLGPWTVAQARPNAAFWLRSGLLRVRVLHDGPGGTVPPPGTNRARITYYENEQLALFGAEASLLLALWHVDTETKEVSVRVVRPRGRWKLGQAIRADLDFVLPRVDVELDGMEWWPLDEELELPLEVDADESQEDEDAGGDSG